ncbi:MAG TPA: hypothetical protein VN457_08340 [Chlamydiales bacterium]|nr:hypothetical protein [Chlamydiales bacterium]
MTTIFCQLLSADIVEIRLQIDNMVCPFCGRSCIDDLKRIPGVEDAKVWPGDGLAVVVWKPDHVFQSVKLYRSFADSHFLLKIIDIDVEGIIEMKKGAMTLRSEPDNSIFYIDNREDRRVSKFEDGQLVHIQGQVYNQSGFNFLVIKDILPTIK